MNRKRKSPALGPMRILAALLIAAAAVLIFLVYTGRLDVEMVKELFAPGGSRPSEDTVFTYESGTRQTFTRVGDGLAVASASGGQLFGADGQLAARQIFAMTTPAVAASKTSCVFFDVGGTAMRVMDMQGAVKNLDTQQAIVSVTMNASGWIAAVTEEHGSKGHISVYGKNLELIYEWLSGSGDTGYILSARVAPDNKGMAVLSLDKAGGKITFFSFVKEEAETSYTAPAELLIDFDYLTPTRLAAVSEERLVIVNVSGNQTAEYRFDGMHLRDYELHESDFAVLFLEKYHAVGEGRLITIGSAGNVLGDIETGRSLISLSSYDKNVLALYGDGLVLYTRGLELAGEYGGTAGQKRAILRSGNEALLLTAYSAEIYKF